MMIQRLGAGKTELGHQLFSSAGLSAFLHDLLTLTACEVRTNVCLNNRSVGNTRNGLERTDSFFNFYQLLFQILRRHLNSITFLLFTVHLFPCSLADPRPQGRNHSSRKFSSASSPR